MYSDYVNENLFFEVEEMMGPVAKPTMLPIALLWTIIDSATDWNGDVDAVLEAYEAANRAFDSYMNEEPEMPFYEIISAARRFENQLYVACVCWNAYEVIEAGARNIWSTDGALEKLNKHFKKQRAEFNSEIEAKLAVA